MRNLMNMTKEENLFSQHAYLSMFIRGLILERHYACDKRNEYGKAFSDHASHVLHEGRHAGEKLYQYHEGGKACSHCSHASQFTRAAVLVGNLIHVSSVGKLSIKALTLLGTKDLRPDGGSHTFNFNTSFPRK